MNNRSLSTISHEEKSTSIQIESTVAIPLTEKCQTINDLFEYQVSS